MPAGATTESNLVHDQKADDPSWARPSGRIPLIILVQPPNEAYATACTLGGTTTLVNPEHP